MSQWGAQGAALAGKSVDEILNFYYPGTSVGRFSGPLRIWLTEAGSRGVVVQAQPGLRVTSQGTSVELAEPEAVRYRLRYASDDTVVLGWAGADGRWRRYGTTEAALFQDSAAFKAGRGGTVALVVGSTSTPYRGKIGVVNLPGTATLAINTVRVEEYLRGVVPAESPASWEPAALQAQAVAARTYAAYHAGRARAAGRSYDLCDTTACQVYPGSSTENSRTDAAVAATAATIRTYQGSPILAEFSASNGGYTVATTVPYQRAFEDSFDRTPTNPNNAWTVELSAQRARELFPTAGEVTAIRVTSRDGKGAGGGRALSVTVEGTTADVVVSASDFAGRLGLRSTFFSVTPPR